MVGLTIALIDPSQSCSVDEQRVTSEACAGRVCRARHVPRLGLDGSSGRRGCTRPCHTHGEAARGCVIVSRRSEGLVHTKRQVRDLINPTRTHFDTHSHTHTAITPTLTRPYHVHSIHTTRPDRTAATPSCFERSCAVAVGTGTIYSRGEGRTIDTSTVRAATNAPLSTSTDHFLAFVNYSTSPQQPCVYISVQLIAYNLLVQSAGRRLC